MLHQIIDRIREQQNISREELEILLTTEDKEALDYLRMSAREVADFIQYAKKHGDNSIEIGPGRGSAAGSLVCR